jgi:hypothetical protein
LEIGHDTEVADTDESLRQDVKQKTSDELVGRDGHRSHLVAAGVIPPTEGNAFAIEGDEPVVGDGDTMSITAEISDDLFWAAEGGFGINNPILTKQQSEERREVFRFHQMVDRSGAGQPVLVMRVAESGDELSTKHFGESFDGQ